LQPEIAICYQREVHVLWKALEADTGDHQKKVWITSGLAVFYLLHRDY